MSSFARKFFIDCGGYDGCSVRKFRAEFDPKTEFDIYSFEANPAFANCFEEFPKHTFLSKAVWTEDGQLPFYIDRKRALGSTLLSQKKSGWLDREKPVMTESVNLSAWLQKNITLHDEVILKLDIEGAEYPILQQMIQEGSITLIQRLFIEWHWDKIGLSETKHLSLVSELQKKGVFPEDWDALDYVLPENLKVGNAASLGSV